MHSSDTFRNTSAVLLSLGAVLHLGGCSLFTELDTLRDGEGVQSSDIVDRHSMGGAGGGGGLPSSSSGAGGEPAGTGGGGGVPGATGSGGGGGSPCAPEGIDYAPLVINEVAPDGDPLDWIEIVNTSSEPMPLCEVFITQHYEGGEPPSGVDRYTFGDVTLAPMERLVLQTEIDFLFGLAKDSTERVTLFAPSGAMIDDTQWVADATTPFSEAQSWARVPDLTGDFARAAPTKGSANTP